jgi:Spy/CpxP family protein refolding chaperone
MRLRKMLMLTITLAGAALLLSVVAGDAPFSILGAATVQAGPPPPPGGPGALDQRLLDQLNLTDEQKTHINALLDAQRTDTQPIHEELMQARAALHAAAEASTFDDAEVTAQAVTVGQATAELTIRQTRTEWSTYQLLTTEQQTRLAELRKQLGPPPRWGH